MYASELSAPWGPSVGCLLSLYLKNLPLLSLGTSQRPRPARHGDTQNKDFSKPGVGSHFRFSHFCSQLIMTIPQGFMI